MCCARFARGSALESASTKNNRYRKNRLRPGSCSTGFAGKSIFEERRKFFSCTIFHAERDFADFFLQIFLR